MSTLHIMINGRDYQVACDDGQETHVKMLADDIDNRVRALSSRMGQAGDSVLLVLASLMMADELHEIRQQISDFKKQNTGATASDQSRMEEMEQVIAGTISEIALRIEKIADQIERS